MLQEVIGEGFNQEGALGSETRELEDVEAMEVVGATTGVNLTVGVTLETGVQIGEGPHTVMDIRGLITSVAMGLVLTELVG